jgi:RNA polymerase sigma factor (sigma-70 family)
VSTLLFGTPEGGARERLCSADSAAARGDFRERNDLIDALVARAHAGEEKAAEELLERFRPLMRARMHWLWQSLREDTCALEWADVEAQVQVLFLSRLQRFRAEDGVYFPHYAARLLDLDCRDWLRRQRRSQAVPFSQLPVGQSEDDEGSWLEGALATGEAEETSVVDDVVSLRGALQVLSEPQRDVIHLCYGRGLTEAAAAQQLGISRSAVRNRLQGAVERLRAFFGPEGGGCGAQAPLGQGTRTGRASSLLSPLNYFTWRTFMAKDDRRPDLVGVGAGRPVLLQGVFDFDATGLKTPQLLSPRLRYVVPPGHVAGIRFLRVGVTCQSMVCVATMVNGMPHRLVPVAANSASHIAFAIVEPIRAGSEIELHLACDTSGVAIIDLGCLEMPA